LSGKKLAPIKTTLNEIAILKTALVVFMRFPSDYVISEITTEGAISVNG